MADTVEMRGRRNNIGLILCCIEGISFKRKDLKGEEFCVKRSFFLRFLLLWGINLALNDNTHFNHNAIIDSKKSSNGKIQ